jgi:hypothetical protein
MGRTILRVLTIRRTECEPLQARIGARLSCIDPNCSQPAENRLNLHAWHQRKSLKAVWDNESPMKLLGDWDASVV